MTDVTVIKIRKYVNELRQKKKKKKSNDEKHLQSQKQTCICIIMCPFTQSKFHLIYISPNVAFLLRCARFFRIALQHDVMRVVTECGMESFDDVRFALIIMTFAG